MIKKILFPSLIAIVGIALISSIFQRTEKQYSERVNLTSESEPYIMRWAQVNAITGEYDPMASIDAKRMIAQKVNRQGEIGLKFAMRGPDNVGGRTRAVIELIGKPDTLISGGVTGGLWVSYDAGGTWQPHQQFQNMEASSAMIASIHQDAVSGKIYVGTGSSFDAFANVARVPWPGYGVYVSEDEGVTFTHIETTAPLDRYSISGSNGNQWIATNRIRTTTEGYIYAATESGLWYSEDGGDSWENPVSTQSGAVPSKCADVAITPDQKVVVTYVGGSTFIKENATTDFVQINGQERGLPTGGGRTVLAVSPTDGDYIYIMFIGSDACLNAIYKSSNGGATFTKLLEEHDEFTPFSQEGGSGGGGCQGVYDAALLVSALDPETIYIGGLELWRYDGSLTRVATEFGAPPFQDVSERYVHADKHYFANSPNDPNRFYVTTDGGISMSENRGTTWQGINKGYITTQFYGVSHFNGGGSVVGGSQDNGTLVVLGDNVNDGQVGFQVFGNDGILSDASQVADIIFASSQNGLVVRADVSAGTAVQPPIATFSDMGSGGPFHTVVKLWENTNDPSSKDSVIFSVEQTEFAMATGNGIVRNFNETFSPIQLSANVLQNSLVVTSSGMTLTIDPSNPGVLIGDGEGTVVFNEDRSIDISVTFETAPAENSNIFLRYDENYKANSMVVLESDNLKSLQGAFTFKHRLENDLNPGDIIKVQDPVQSYLFSTGQATAGGAIRFYRNVLNSQSAPPAAIGIPEVSGTPSIVEVTEEGDVAYVGTQQGRLFRISGLSDVYTQEDADSKLTVDLILTTGAGGITGIAVDANDNSRLAVSCGGYGSADRVRFTENALAATPVFNNVHGDLVEMPIYSIEINLNDPNMVVIGTEFGIWATSDITANSVTWSDENDDKSYIPIYAMKQQHLPRSEASNSGVVYVGSFGRGFWESTDELFVGTPEFANTPSTEKFISDFKVFPNPIQTEGRISFEVANSDEVSVDIYDINGRQVKSWKERVNSGQNNLTFNTINMRSGSYFATITSGGNRESAKFLVIK